MSLLAIAASIAAASAAPTHSVDVEHGGARYDVHYVSHVELSSKAVGVSPPTRTSTRRCLTTFTVSVERKIHGENGAAPLRHILPATRTFTESNPGECRAVERQLETFRAARDETISGFVASAARDDHAAVLAAIDAARALAVN